MRLVLGVWKLETGTNYYYLVTIFGVILLGQQAHRKNSIPLLLLPSCLPPAPLLSEPNVQRRNVLCIVSASALHRVESRLALRAK